MSSAAGSIARSLLGLLSIEVNPVTSREYLLLVRDPHHCVAAGSDADAGRSRAAGEPASVAGIVGALPLDDFFPQRERQGLMIRLNGLIASPKFQAWKTAPARPGDDAARARSPAALVCLRSRICPMKSAHLGRGVAARAHSGVGVGKQGGSNTLRAVVLIDEIFGYFRRTPRTRPRSRRSLDC